LRRSLLLLCGTFPLAQQKIFVENTNLSTLADSYVGCIWKRNLLFLLLLLLSRVFSGEERHMHGQKGGTFKKSVKFVHEKSLPMLYCTLPTITYKSADRWR
jgi:hypothetical protein